MENRLEEWPLRRHFKAAIRFGLVAAAVTAIFWGLWSIFWPVPRMSVIFKSTRWWDVPGAFLAVVSYWLIIVTAAKIARRLGTPTADIVDALGISGIVGTVAGLAFATISTPLAGPILSIISGIFIGISIGIWLNLKSIPFIILGIGLGCSIANSLIFGLILSLVTAPASLAAYLLVFAAIEVSKGLRARGSQRKLKDLRRRIWIWLTAA